MSWDDYFLKVLNIRFVLSVYALMVFKNFWKFVYVYTGTRMYQSQSFCLLLWNYFIILKIRPVNLLQRRLWPWECIQEAACDTENCSESRLWCVHRKNQPMAEKQRRKSTSGREENLEKNSAAASGTIFRISRCSQRSKLKLLLTFLF